MTPAPTNPITAELRIAAHRTAAGWTFAAHTPTALGQHTQTVSGDSRIGRALETIAAHLAKQQTSKA